MFGDGGLETSGGSIARGELEPPLELERLCASSIDGNAMLPARFLSAVAKEDVRRKVLLTPLEIVLVIVSLRVKGGRPEAADGA